MKSFGTPTLNALASGKIIVRALVQVQLVEGTYGFWNDAGAIVVGGITYYGTGSLGGVSAVAGVTNLSTPAIEYTLSGLDAQVLLSFFGYTWHQQPIQLYMALFDSTFTLVDTPSLMASGRMDKAVKKGAKGKTQSLVITAEDVSRRLSWTNPSVRTHGDQDIRASGDTFFQYVTTTAERELYWGIKQRHAAPVNPLSAWLKNLTKH